MRTRLLSFLLLTTLTSIAQTNETPNALFTWKKSKTEFKKGYVVLKSGKKNGRANCIDRSTQ